MSYKREEYLERIRSIMPAPGWTALGCHIDSDDVAHFVDLDVVGWAIVDCEVVAGRNIKRLHERVKLLVSNGDGEARLADNMAYTYSLPRVFPPGVIPTGKDRADLADHMRDLRDYKARRKQKTVSVAVGSSR
ncbi:MAG: hypothetical protein WBQ07_21700 [Candidatus Acidiferrales bacterium]